MDKVKCGEILHKILVTDCKDLLDNVRLDELYSRFDKEDAPYLTDVLSITNVSETPLEPLLYMSGIVENMYKGSEIEELVIPENITNIGYNAFKDCARLKRIYYKGTEKEWKAIIAKNYTGIDFEKVEVCFYKNKNTTYWYYDKDGNKVTWQEN